MVGKKTQIHVPGYKAKGQKYKSLLVMQYLLKHAESKQSGVPFTGIFTTSWNF